MSIARNLQNAGLFVIEDSRAKNRITDAPEKVSLSYIPSDDILEAIHDAAGTYPCPTALILTTGQVIVLAEFGKGGIAVQGAKGQETPAQKEALPIVASVVSDAVGAPLDADLKKAVKASASEPSPAEEPSVEDAPAEPAEEQQ
jgi:hypothetical protein